MVRVVLDAMTVDGYNPYRIATDGPDWEVPDPEDPWANIGYWSDHQVVYLDRLLAAHRRLVGSWDPGDLTVRDRVYADVPYRLVGFDEALAGTGDTILFDAEAHRRACARAALVGTDGRLREVDGELLRASMAEKLLLVIAAKLVNLVPGAGIWMNTQRPEWNDANNALVGRGVSVVTAAQLHTFVTTVKDLVRTLDADEVPVSAPLAGPVAGPLCRPRTHRRVRRFRDGSGRPPRRHGGARTCGGAVPAGGVRGPPGHRRDPGP